MLLGAMLGYWVHVGVRYGVHAGCMGVEARRSRWITLSDDCTGCVPPGGTDLSVAPFHVAHDRLEGWVEHLDREVGEGLSAMGANYKYTGDLLGLDRCTPLLSDMAVPEPLSHTVSPLKLGAWERALAAHPDAEYTQYLLRGIREGFRIGYDRRSPLRSAGANMPSANERAEVVDEYLSKECAEGRMVGPLNPKDWLGIHTSPFGVIPKSTPGKWRLITNLSAPQHYSVNDGISRDLSSLSYITVDSIVEQVRALGRGTQLAKMDIQSAYRVVPVHKDDRCLLGVKWRDQLYVDCALSFGLRSACKIFTSIADAVEWIASNRGARGIAHYLDDYVVVGAPLSGECGKSLKILLDLCAELGIPVAVQKGQDPTTCLIFLGIEFDTLRMEIRLPREKLERLQALIASWLGKKSCQRVELESLVGHLHHACKVVRPGRRFVRGILGLLSRTHGRHHYARLNESCRSDIEWWHAFVSRWNGISMMMKSDFLTPDVQLWTDASGSWGCGAVWGAQWIQISWQHQVPPTFTQKSIAVKELLPIIIAVGTWGRCWKGSTVLCHCDNEAVVSVINKGACKDKHCLFFMEAEFNLSLAACHVPGKANIEADAISRGNLSAFFTSNLQAHRQPVPVNPALLGCLTRVEPNWMSADWISSFSSTFTRP